MGIVNSLMGKKQIMICFGIGASILWMVIGLAEQNFRVYIGFGLVSVLHDVPHDIVGTSILLFAWYARMLKTPAINKDEQLLHILT